MSEQSVASARASVLVYDSGLKKWVPSGSSNGLSKVHIYHHIENNTFRVVGRMVQGHEVVINCSILKGLKYFQATPTFHQWRDNSQIHGLNFASREDAETFALAMERVLDILGHSSSSRSNQSQPLYQTIGHSGVSLDDYAEYRGWMNNENGERKTTSEYGHYRPSHVNQQQHSSHPNTPGGTTPSPSSSYSHHRASSTPPQQQMSVLPPQQPSTPQSAVPPPPPPPPPPPSNPTLSGLATLPRLHLRQQNPEEEVTENSLAAALAQAKLKKTPTKPQPNEASGSEKGFPMRGMACMLDEMTKTLARRRAQTDSSLDAEAGSGGDRNWNRQNSANAYSPNRNSGGDSPQSIRSRSDVDSEGGKYSPVTATDMLRFREDIVADLKAELHKVKQEIIDAVRMELNRR